MRRQSAEGRLLVLPHEAAVAEKTSAQSMAVSLRSMLQLIIPPRVDGCQIAQNRAVTVRVFPERALQTSSRRFAAKFRAGRSNCRLQRCGNCAAAGGQVLNAHNGFRRACDLESECRASEVMG